MKQLHSFFFVVIILFSFHSLAFSQNSPNDKEEYKDKTTDSERSEEKSDDIDISNNQSQENNWKEENNSNINYDNTLTNTHERIDLNTTEEENFESDESALNKLESDITKSVVSTFSTTPIIISTKCYKTTEAGEDEIFYQFISKGSTGYWSGTVPSSSHWSINDNGNNTSIGLLRTVKAQFYYGAEATLIVSLFEQDGGNFQQYGRIAEYVLSACSDARCLAAQSVLQAARILGFNIVDSDDFIGSFSLQYGYDIYGNFYSKCTILERGTVALWGTGYKVYLNGDGSSYVLSIGFGP